LNINEGYDINKAKSLLQANPFLKDSADKITDQNLIDIGNGLVFLHLDDTFKHAKLSHAASSELPGSKFNSEYLTDDQLISLIKEIVKKNVPEEKVENNVRKLKWFNIDTGKEIGLDSVIKKDKLPSNLSSSNYEYKEKIGNVKAIPFILKNPDVAIFDSNNNKITLDNVDKIDTSGATSYYIVQPLQVVNMPLIPTTKVNLILAVIGDLDDKTRLVSLMTIFPGEADEKLMNKQDYIKAGYVFLKPKNIKENVDLVNEGITDNGVDKKMILPNFTVCTINVDIENGIVTKVNQDIEDDEVYSYRESNFEDGLKPFKNAGVKVDYTPWETEGFTDIPGGFFIDAESLNNAIKNNKIKIISDPNDDKWLVFGKLNEVCEPIDETFNRHLGYLKKKLIIEETGKKYTQQELTEKYKQGKQLQFIKNTPVALIPTVDLEKTLGQQKAEEVLKLAGLVDKTSYSDEFKKGGYVVFQWNSKENKPDIYIADPTSVKQKYSEFKGELPTDSKAQSKIPSLVVLKHLGISTSAIPFYVKKVPTNMIKASDVGLENSVIETSWGEQTVQVGGYLVREDNGHIYTVAPDATGLPIGYVSL
jgi:hypothetical protein